MIIYAATSDTVYQLLAHGRWFSPGTPASSTTKTSRHDIGEILLKVALNTINQIIIKYKNKQYIYIFYFNYLQICQCFFSFQEVSVMFLYQYCCFSHVHLK